jgi:hypothetical protein
MFVEQVVPVINKLIHQTFTKEKHMKSLMRIFVIAAAMCFVTGQMFAQLDTLGGPYTPDANTVLLLHFDGNLTNAAAVIGKTAAAAVPHSTNLAGKISYINQSGPVAGLGKAIRIDNSSINDSTYLTIADTASLDMQGSWTIEAWANIFTFGSGSTDYRWVPRIVMKPGDDLFWHPNYWTEMWGDSRTFQVGFYTPADQFVSTSSPTNMFVPGEWVHLTFIRDTARAFVACMVHDANKTLRGFFAQGFDKTTTALPKTNSQDLHMGWAGSIKLGANGSGDSWLDGFIDEVRISNVVRNFSGPPVIQQATILPNQSSAIANYPVSISVFPLATTGTMSAITLYYRADTNVTFSSTSLSSAGNNKYTGTIPGQTGGKVVQYYYKTVDNNNQVSFSPNLAETTKKYYTFAVYTPNSKVLDLTFEEGPSGKPIDHSTNNAVIKTLKDFKYSTDKPIGGGTYSLNVKGSDGLNIDSNWVEAASPFLAVEEFSLDCWMKADSAATHAARIIINPSAETDWNNANFELSFRNGAAGKPVFTARYWKIDGTGAIVLQDSLEAQTAHTGKWRHIILERNKTNGNFAMVIRNENDQLMFKQVKNDMTAPLMAGAALRIGRSWFDVTNQYYVSPYRGLIDNVKVFNYPASGITGVSDEPVGLVHEFKLAQNYPNPFNPTTEIEFSIPTFQNVSLVIYDVLGKQVKTLVNEQRHAGEHRVTWNGTNNLGNKVSSGVYFYKLTSGSFTQVRKMMMLK